MMNVSEMLTSMKMDLGIYGLKLPFDDPNKALTDTITLRTIKTFSQFYPHIVRLDLHLNELVNIKSHYNESIYQLPDIFGDRRIMYVRKVMPKNKLLGNGYVNPTMDGSMDMFNNLLMGQVSADLMSAAVPPFTFKFKGPNLLYLYNMSTMAAELTIEFGVEHSENLATIPNTAWETFYELALLDVKRLLYHSMKHYDNLQTAVGTIQLHIEDWQNAEQERKDLIERWRDVYHLDTEQFFII